MIPEPDRLAATLSADAQRQAAHVAQDAFATVFRLTVDDNARRERQARWPRSGSAAATGVPPAPTVRRARCAASCSPPGLTSGD